MKKILFIIILVVIISGGVGYYFSQDFLEDIPTFFSSEKNSGQYLLKVYDKTIESFESKDEAVQKAKEVQRSVVVDKDKNKWVYSSLQNFMIITDTAIHDFDNLDIAIRYAKRLGYDTIYFKNDKNIIWSEKNQLAPKIKLNVPLIQQYPELPRGCEVTSLAMLLCYSGYNVSKMELAEKVKKDNTPYEKDKNGRIHYGNPYDGFVGDIYNIKNYGYGVYHGPIAELASQYVKDDTIDITGLEFEDMLYFLSKGNPIWVITNATYDVLPEEAFEMWHTPTGIIKVTTKQHSVVITGYDEDSIYINDPLYPYQNRKLNKLAFKKAWEQMGNQAVVIMNE